MSIRSAALALVLLILGSSLFAQPVTSSVAKIPADAKLAGTGVVYSKSFFQERYMKIGKTIGYALFVPGAFQNAVWRATGKYEAKPPVRQEAGPFEALLGDFDVTAYTGERLRARITEASRFKIDFTNDPALAEAIINFAAADPKEQKVLPELPAGTRDVTCIAKVSYGLGARAGREQLGFKKTYRPFVRLLADVQKPGGEHLWHGAVIAWGEKGYKGSDAKQAPKEELIEAFRSTSNDAVSLFIRSLNGETLEPMGELVDETSEDARF